MYLLIGFIVALGSVFVPSLIGALLSKEEKSKTIIMAAVVTVVYGAIVWFLMWAFRADIYGPTPLFGWIIIGAVISAIIAGNSEEGFVAALLGIGIALILFVWVLVVFISSWDMNRSMDKGKLLDVEVKNNSKIMSLADPAHISLVDENMARAKAEKVLGQVVTEDGANAGSRYELGQGTKQWVDGQLWWIFALDFKSYWQWSRFPNAPGYIRVSAEDPFAEAQSVQHNKQGQEIKIKYLNSASFDVLTERYLRKNGFLRSKIGDFTFEVDDNWNPYYTITQREWTIGYEAPVVTNVIVFDVSFATWEICPIDQVKEKFPWIDRANDLSVIDYQAQKWGMYSEVGWNFTSRYDGKRKEPTDGWYLTYDNGICYWFSGWTSYSSSSDLIGISMTDANNGKTIYYPTVGCTEAAAYTIAKGHWSNFEGYEPTELVPYNIYGMLTYVMPITYNKTEFRGVSLVSVVNKDINAKGNTLEEALSAYRSAMGTIGSQRGVPYEGQANKLTITAKVSEVGMPFIQGQSQMYPFTLQGVDKIFQINYSLQNAKVSFLKPGREVTVVYLDTKEKIISCLSIDISDLKLSDENPAQAKWVENQKIVRKEEERIDNIHGNRAIIESGDMGEVHPDSLKKFIESQKKYQK